MKDAMLQDKSILVTGGGEGIGRESSIHFARNGARVVVADISEAKGRATVEAIKAEGGEAVFIRTDVTKQADVEAMVACAVDTYGALHGAFNNAGVEMSNKLISELDLSSWQRVIDVDLNGVFLCLKHEIRAMKNQGGSIVNNSSGNGEIGQAFAADYVSAKHGVVGLTRAASTEFPHTRVRVNAVLPGLVLTPMVKDRLMKDAAFSTHLEAMKVRHSVGRFGEPIDIARAAKWLLSDESSFVNGCMLNIDGGYTAR